MRGGLIHFSKGQLIILWCAVFAFLAVTAIAALAADPNLQIDSSKVQPPLCTWEIYDGGRLEGSWDACKVRISGNNIETYKSYLITRYGSSMNTIFGFSPEYCYYTKEQVVPLSPGNRGSIYCPPLNDMVQFSVSSDKITEGGKFSINWKAPTAKSCVLSGNAPETGNFENEFKTGAVTLLGDSRTYDFVKRGIYTFKFGCKGYLDNKNSPIEKPPVEGTISRTKTVFVGEIPPAPTVTLKADPDNIKSGEGVTLSWSSSNAIAVSINSGVGVVAKSGSMKVFPKFTTRYTINAAGEFPELGLAGYSATVRVTAATATQQVAQPVEIPQEQPVVVAPVTKPEVGLLVNGQKGPLIMGAPANITLSWATNQYCVAYGSWLGIKTKADKESRTLTTQGTYTYNLYCPGLGSDSVKVTIPSSGSSGAVIVPMPVAEASVSSDNKNFTKSIRVVRGQSTHLWLSAGYDVTGDKRASRDAAGSWSGYMSNGGACDWNYDLNQGTPTFDVRIPNPASPKDCAVDLGSVTFYDQPGTYTYGVLRLVQVDGKVSNISSINIAVDPPPPPDTAPVVDLQVNGMKNKVILGAPANYTVVWNVHNADSCAASDDWSGNKFLSGSQNFVASSKRDLTYTLTCFGKLGTTTQSILVKVAELPVCDFSALPTALNKQSVFEQQSVLSWKCQFANTCLINPSTGVSTGTFGSVRVSPVETTKYTLTCQNLDGSSSFDQVVEVQ